MSLSNWFRQAHPGVQFEIENRAISGFQADLLARTAATDVAEFAPDLIILHCYGDEVGMDKLLEVLRSKTTAEIIVQQDHPHLPDQRYESVDQARLTIVNWWAYRNYVWLPRLCEKYRCCLLRVRDVWKAYLLKHKLVELDLLQDSTHMNPEGNQLLTTVFITYLQRETVESPLDPENTAAIRTASVDLEDPLDPWTVSVVFTGRRLELWMDLVSPSAGSGFDALVTLDGNSPSKVDGVVHFTRTSFVQGFNWPAILQFGLATNLIAQEWKAVLTEVGPAAGWFRFRVEGSVTGPDGEGISTVPFLSNSGQVQIRPEDWMIPIAAANSKQVPEVGFEIHWEAKSGGADRMSVGSSALRRVGDRWGWFLLADNLAETPHLVQLTSASAHGPGLIRFRVMAPSDAASIQATVAYHMVGLPQVRIRRKEAGLFVVWPESVEGRATAVEWTRALDPKAEWRPLGASGEAVYGQNTRAIPLDLSHAFFRLRVP